MERLPGPDGGRQVQRCSTRLSPARHAAGVRRRLGGASPSSDYTPDFLPLSIGIASRRAAGRLTLNFQAKQGWFVDGTGAYTWRGKVTLDRPAYFTDDQLFLSDEVAMPDVFDYTVSAGYWKHGLLRARLRSRSRSRRAAATSAGRTCRSSRTA